MSHNHSNQPSPIELLNLLHVRQGHFKLESGHHGNLWLDLDQLFLRPKEIQPFVIELARRISSFGVDAVCGPMAGGALIAQTIALELGVNFLYTEQVVPQNPQGLYSVVYRLPSYLRSMIDGWQIAIVDDVINAGSAIRGTLAELESMGARPVVVGSLLVLGETGQNFFRERGLPVRCITHLPNEIWVPQNCPLCSSHIPLNNPG
jgi:orotate phosphoribosyltransferase